MQLDVSKYQLYQCSGELSGHPRLYDVLLQIHRKAVAGCNFNLSDSGVFCMRLDNGNP